MKTSIRIIIPRRFLHGTVYLRTTPTATTTTSTTPGVVTPLELYNQRVHEGKLKDDPYQRKIITSLSILHEKLQTYTPPTIPTPDVSSLTPRIGISKIFSSFLGKDKSNSNIYSTIDEEKLLTESNPIKGIYLYGDVGCGKTMLMDLFYKTIPPNLPKKRLHFHQFMQNLHKRTHQLKMLHQKNHHHDIDVIPLLAAEIAQSATVLCFDEFQVTDVADAMILRKLMMLLLSPQYGLILFATSNRAPDELYMNGIQRASFIPVIQLLKRQTMVVYLLSPTDYRRTLTVSRKEHENGPYYFGTDEVEREEHVKFWWEYFGGKTNDKEVLNGFEVEVWGRKIIVPKASPPKVAEFTFDELCGKPRAAGDYLQLASTFESFVITDIPYLTRDFRDEIRRFITFLDAVYDSHGRIAVTAVAPFDKLLKTDDFFEKDEEKFAFNRALSRLAQMQSSSYVD
ncbi:putative mitochondrial ATPase [Candida maltosa Xu316]|uniref:Putative mitochondrial ATPase n=1 Tax=Candida maltosa (strain Xu316) TaxID=1245528 RepID=M3JVT7_CANMX|nr:putative mitochondrial ATPase [Candida maltosa Xu316]